MALYERLVKRNDLGQPVNGKLPIHQFQACLAEFGRGVINGTQAQAIITSLSGTPLDAGEIAEAQTLLNTITSLPAGQRLARVKLIDDVLMLAERNCPGYGLPSQVKTRLGV